MGDATAGETPLRSFHRSRDAVFETVRGREVVAHYGRQGRAHRAVRAAVGVTAVPADAVVLTGADRREYLNNVVTNVVPEVDGRGCYAFLLDPQGRIETDLVVYADDDRLLAFTPPGVAEGVVDGWETFIQDVEIRVATAEYVVLGVHGPRAAETVRRAVDGPDLPEAPFAFVRGSVGGAAATVARNDAPAAEVGLEIVCAASDATAVLDGLVGSGDDVVPFGRATWRTLTLEAGTPEFESELVGRIPNVTGLGGAVDFEKGCFVGQEVVSKVQNRGQPSRRLVGLVVETGLDDPGSAAGGTVVADGEAVGEVTRAAASPVLEATIALAYVDFELEGDVDLAVELDSGTPAATLEPLPFVEGSERSGRVPRYGRE